MGDGPCCSTETDETDGDDALAALAMPVRVLAHATALSASSASQRSIWRSSSAKSRRTSSRHVPFDTRVWQQRTRDSNSNSWSSSVW